MRGRRQRERGAAAVEMAIILPVLVLLLGGMVDFGRAYFNQVILTNAAREGVRAAVVLTTGTPNAAIKARAEAAANGAPGVSATVNQNCVGATSATNATVTVAAPFTWFFLDAFIPGMPASFSRNATMGCL